MKTGGRPKSDLTNNNVFVGIRLTPAQKAEYKRLGGPAWLRKALAKSIEDEWKKSQPIINRILNRVIG